MQRALIEQGKMGASPSYRRDATQIEHQGGMVCAGDFAGESDDGQDDREAMAA